MKLAKQKLLFLGAILIALSCFAQVAKSQSFTLIKSNYLPANGPTLTAVYDEQGNSEYSYVAPGYSYTSPYQWTIDTSSNVAYTVSVDVVYPSQLFADFFISIYLNGVEYTRRAESYIPGEPTIDVPIYIDSNALQNLTTLEVRLESPN